MYPPMLFCTPVLYYYISMAFNTIEIEPNGHRNEYKTIKSDWLINRLAKIERLKNSIVSV